MPIVRRGRPRHAYFAVIGVLFGGVGGSGPARAFDFFGWFGEKPPPVSTSTLPYEITIKGLDDDKAAKASIEDVSLLYRLRAEPPANGDELARRAESDLPRVVDALWGAGYYAAKASVVVAGQPISIERPGEAAARIAADRLRGRVLAPVEIVVDPGPLYRFSDIAVVNQSNGRGFDRAVMPDYVVALQRDDPARTTSVLSAAAHLSDYFRDQGHPFVRVKRRAPIIDHPSRTVDLTFVVEPGPVARLGAIAVTGEKDVDPAVIRSFIYAEPGDPYSPKALAAIRKSVARIEAIGSVRVREAAALDRAGDLPLTVEVTERLPRVVGGSVRYSTVDGPALKAYWAHRNLFGGAERLRLDADLFYFPTDQNWANNPRKKGFDTRDLGGRFSFSFMKPALWGSRNDLLIDAYALREKTDFYTAKLVNATVGIRHRFTDSFSIQGAVEGEIGQSIDPLGKLNYGLVGLPLSVIYDSTDKPLDATRGFKVTASVAPYHGFVDAPSFFGIGRVQASTYYALDERARYVLAARIGFGSIIGGELAQIPASRRFYAGGGGSVRGFEYKSLGPRNAQGFVVGGKSLIEGSVEARIKITDTIGVVPFVDVGQAYASEFPDGSQRLRVGAGIGLRYYTSIGPIRVDIAMPVDRRRGERPYAIYVSLGQSF